LAEEFYLTMISDKIHNEAHHVASNIPFLSKILNLFVASIDISNPSFQ